MSAGHGGDGALDVAIVGGGVSGLYSAWRLCAQEPGTRLAVFELGATVGGRLKAFAFDAAPDLRVELGGMTFSHHHRRVAAAVEALRLPLHDGTREKLNDILFLRGRAVRRRRIKRRWIGPLTPFALPRHAQVRGYMPTLLDAAETLVPGAATMTRGDWQALHDAGSPLAATPYRAALEDVLGAEHVSFLAARSGISLFTEAPSALHALEWLVEQQRMGKARLRPRGGLHELADALARAVEALGGAIHTRRRLVGIEASEPGFALRFRDAATGGEEVVAARRLILALPRAALEAIEEFPARDADGSPLSKLLPTVEPFAIGRLMLLYPHAWWAPLRLGGGHSATDLPLGQVAFRSVPPGSGPPAAVATMTFDGATVSFWRALAEAPEGGFITLGAEAPLAREAHRQLQAMFGPLLRTPPPAPLSAALQDWSRPPFGGAIHLWASGADAGRSADAMLKPFGALDLFVCGEAWSHAQGWVEGALERADTVLARWFDVPPLCSIDVAVQ